MAGSSVTVTRTKREIGRGAKSNQVEIVKISWVADDSDGSVPATEMELDGWLIKAITDPGATAPTDNYDITLVDANGSVDAANSQLLNRSTDTSQQVYPVVDTAGTGGPTPVLLAGTYTFTLENNSENDALGDVWLYLVSDI